MKDQDWNISRKNFVRTMLLGGLALQLPWLQSCTDEHGFPIPANLDPLTKDQFVTLQHLLLILFPDDGNGPSAIDIHADQYILWVLNDPELDPNENNFIIEKLDLFQEKCAESLSMDFKSLSIAEQQDFVSTISREKWGKRWMSRLLTLIFEALLLDPSYGGNSEEVGWNWLAHNPGYPRPHDKIRYPNILSLKHEV